LKAVSFKLEPTKSSSAPKTKPRTTTSATTATTPVTAATAMQPTVHKKKLRKNLESKDAST
jgi:hypothetical protein